MPVPATSTRIVQSSLPGFDQDLLPVTPDHDVGGRREAVLGYGLWLAVFPSADDARHIATAARTWHLHHGLTGALLPPKRLHMTLLAIAGGAEPPSRAVVDTATAAAAAVSCAPIPIVFDRAQTFPASNAYVLRCAASSDAALASLRKMLAWRLKRRHLHPTASSTPHMTLAYDPRCIAEHPIEPIRWMATRYALILSHVGGHHHQLLGHWDLQCGRR